MTSILKDRLSRSLLLTDALANAVDDTLLACHLGDAPSNSIGDQFWCIVGARESYARAIAASGWQGFSCSLGTAESEQASAVRAALERSRGTVLDTVSQSDMTDDRVALILTLLEHEAQHHGQLIRYFYANGIAFPAEFARWYALSQPAR